MQIIDVYSSNEATCATNLKNALETYGSSYFDSYETFSDGTYNGVNCYTGESNTLTIKFSSGGCVLAFATRTFSTGSYYRPISKVCVCDKGIVVIPYGNNTSYWYMPLLISKKSNGDTAIVCPITWYNSMTWSSLERWTTSSVLPRCLLIGAIDAQTAETHYKFVPEAFVNGTSTSIQDLTTVIANQLFDPVDGSLLDGVFVVPYMATTMAEPQYFVNNGNTYTGFAYNCLALKGR